MPRQRKGARLWLRPGREGKDGSSRQAVWIIIDGGKHIATGCTAGETEIAERKLAAYIAAKYQPARRQRDIERIDVADVLSIYDEDHKLATAKDQRELEQRLERLTMFWGGKMLAEVTGKTCRDYVASRGRPGGARRDLEVLRAAINHHAEQGFHRELVKVALPDRGDPRDRWLTRDEAARLIWTCWRRRERQTVHRGAGKGRQIDTERRPLRHLARFILIGLYTGTRASAIAAAATTRGDGRSFVDLDRGIYYRLAGGRRATNKRQPPVPIPPRLLAHMRRWARCDEASDRRAAERAGVLYAPRVRHLVEWNGKPISSVKTAMKAAVTLTGLEGTVSPHTLRHTAATWLMQAGVDKWEAAGFLGMSVQMLDRVYGHHHADHLKDAASRIGYRHARKAETLVVSLADERAKRTAAA